MASDSEVLILIPAVLDSVHAEGADPKEATRQHHLPKSCETQRNAVVRILSRGLNSHIPAQTGKKMDGQPNDVGAQCEHHNNPV